MTHLRILHAEDQDSVSKTVDTLLRAHAPECEITLELAVAETFADFKCVAFSGWDAIILDLKFPDADEDTTLAWLAENVTRLGAVIVATGSGRDEHYYESLNCLALGVVFKPDFKSKDEADIKSKRLLSKIYECVLTRRAILKYYGTPQTQ